MAITIAVVTGNEFSAAYDQLVYDQAGRLYAIAVSILRNREEAEDAVQETMVKAWRSWTTVQAEEKRTAWLTRVCVNHCITRYRSGLRKWLSLDESLAPAVEMDHSDPDMDRAFQELSAQQRAVVTLHYQHGYSLDECADLMKVKPGTARSHLARALETLRGELSHD